MNLEESTLKDIIMANRRSIGEYLVFNDRRMSFSEVIGRSEGVAELLRSKGVGKGDRVIIDTGNRIETVLSIFGCIINESVFIPIDPKSSERNFSYIIADSKAVCVLTDRSVPGTVRAHLTPDEVMEVEVGSGPAEVHVTPEDMASIIYTSGSTGEPKGVMLTHGNMVFAARSIISYLKNTKDDIVLCCLPLSFDYGMYQVIMSMAFQGKIVLADSFAYPGKILNILEGERVTGFPIVSSMGSILLKRYDLASRDLSSLRYITNTAQPLPAWVSKGLMEAIPGVEIYSMYGLTECKRTTYLAPSLLPIKPDSVGKAIPGTEVFIIDDNGNKIEEENVIGELVVKGPHIMQGYLNDPDLTSKVIKVLNGERVLMTGDLFHFDADGDLYFHGRRDGLIKVTGEKVYPLEVERNMESIPGVQEAAVIGVPNEIKGSALMAFVVCDDGLDMGSIASSLKAVLESYKVPDRFYRLKEMPRNNNGKIDRKALRMMIEDGS